MKPKIYWSPALAYFTKDEKGAIIRLKMVAEIGKFLRENGLTYNDVITGKGAKA